MWKPVEVAEHFHVSKRTIYRMIERRQIPFHKIGGLIRFKPEDVEKYMENGCFGSLK